MTEIETPKETWVCPRCHLREASEPHPCPYQYNVHDDEETLCECCPECETLCAEDI